MSSSKTRHEDSRTRRAVEMHKAGAPVSQVARELGISTNVVYRALRLDREKIQAEEDRRAHLVGAELATRRASIERLTRGKGPDGSEWVSLAEVLRLLT